MTTYTVNASITYIGWVTVEAESGDEAYDLATEMPHSAWEIDRNTAEIEFNIMPEVQVAP